MLSTSQNTVLPLELNTNTITNNSFNAAPGALNSDLLSPVQTRLQAIASSDDFFTRVFGEKANTAEIQAIRSQWAVGDFSIFPKLQIVDAAVMGEALGAYSQVTQTIYLSDALLANGADDCMFGATGVLIEETFHWLDSLVGDDAPGDEGELARHLIFGVTPDAEELARIGTEQDQGLLWLNGQAVAVEFSGDLAGNNLASARNITLSSTPTTFRDWVGSTDTLDYYRFTLTQTSMVNLSLTDLSADADLSLLDVNGNWLASSWKTGTASENIVKDLNPGTYFIKVQQWSGSTFYNLTVSATAVPDLAGNTFATARNITLSSTPTTFRDWVGSTDTLDYYRFTLTQTSTVHLSLTDLSANADLSLLDVNGNWLTRDWRSGTASKSITRELNAGTYFIEVRQWSGSTFYNLTASATPILPVVTIEATDATAAETNPGQTPNPGRFTLTRTGSTTHALTVNYSIGGTATNGRDYNNLTGTVTFAAGASTAFIDINPINDSEFEDPETVILTLVNSSAYQIGNRSSATVTIWDNDLPTVTIQATDAEAAETNPGQTPNPGRFTLTRTGSTTHALTVKYSIGGTAIGGTDYTIGGTSTSVNFLNRTGTVTFAAGSRTAFIDINPINDSEFEDPETVVITLANSSAYQIGNSSSATVTILDNDLPTVTIEATDAEAAETKSGQPTNPGRFTLTRTGSTTHALTVNYSIGGTATNGSDFNRLTGTVTFAAGSSTAVIDINPIDDTLVEPSETVILTLLGSSTYQIGTSNTATVTILDNDVLPGDWFSQNLRDEELITITRQLALDGILCRNDMISIFRNVQDGGVIDATEFNDLRTIVNNAARFNMPEYVRVLSNKVVNGDRANAKFNVWQPSATDPNTLDFDKTISLGDLFAGSSATHMERLIGKWFLGQDRPTAHTGATMQLRLAQGSLFGTDNQISYADIQQGTLGDCYFLAALGSVAHQQPNTIRNMFIDNGDGTFTVRMFGQMNGQVGAVDYVTVDRFLPVNVRPLGGGSYSVPRYAAYDDSTLGVWVALAEKAYAQFSQSGRTNLPAVTLISGSDPIPNSYEIIGDGAWGYMALPSITGTSSQYYADTNWTFPGTRAGTFPTLSQISTWLASGRAVAAGTIANPTLGIVGRHGYVILGVNAVTNTLTLYNPWGTTPPPGQWGHGEINGVRTITYDDFKLNFRRVDLA